MCYLQFIFNEQDSANSLWSVASSFGVQLIDEPQWSPLIQAALERCNTMNGQQISNSVMALGDFGVVIHDEPQLRPMLEAAVHRRDKTNTQQIANIVLAFANMGVGDPVLIQPLIDAVSEYVDQLRVVEIGACMLAMAKLDIRDPALWIRLCDMAYSQIANFDMQSVSNVSFALAIWAMTANLKSSSVEAKESVSRVKQV